MIFTIFFLLNKLPVISIKIAKIEATHIGMTGVTILVAKKNRNSSIEMYCLSTNKITPGNNILSHIIKSFKYNRKNLLAMIYDFFTGKELSISKSLL